ncbi:MAG: type VI secretion system baseplate subunit TssE [Candidatus Rokuibacteriota bacterium]|nr:MAG: type VI secretion system baseplate subunit TssE [Candidatus Rokubacteria bacterium]PYO09064.1 MAG: type VI secretion system baseplate subunit TssE [Candidatus Rokubacteria bacterium]
MVEVGARDALQPALLDRLTDHDPTRKVEGRDERVLSRAQLRASVLRDLSWLFNSTNLASTVDLSAHPLAAQSTLNYGLTALAGNAVAGLEFAEVEQILKDAILRFEPRILPQTLTVRGIPAKDAMGHHNILSLEITGELWAQPYPVELLIKTDMDLESGEIRLVEGR